MMGRNKNRNMEPVILTNDNKLVSIKDTDCKHIGFNKFLGKCHKCNIEYNMYIVLYKSESMTAVILVEKDNKVHSCNNKIYIKQMYNGYVNIIEYSIINNCLVITNINKKIL